MKSQRVGTILWVLIAISLLIHIFCLIAGRTFLSHVRWRHDPVHACVEIGGGLIAFLVAIMLISLQARDKGSSFNVWIAGALIGMGLLDGFHALVYVGPAFVWLHSTATFVGGLLFVLVWCPDVWMRRVANWWHWAVFAVVFAFGFVSLAFPDIIPTMVYENKFTLTAKGLNVVGGVLLFVAAGRLVRTYFMTTNVDDLLFFLHCSLFGAAAIMFEQSELWDVPWWGWHVLRLLAYGVALWFVVRSELETRDIHAAELRQANLELEQRVSERTSELSSVNKSLSQRAEELERSRQAALSMLQDIELARRKAEQAEQQVRIVIESAPNGMVVVNPEGKITLVNSEMEKLFGYTRDELIGQRVEMLVPQRLRNTHIEHRTSFFEQPQSRPVGAVGELFALRKNGREFPVEIGLSPVQLQEGLFVLAVILDITQRKKSEQALLHERFLLDSLMDNVPDSIYFKDKESRFTRVNKAMAKRHELSDPSEALGKTDFDIFTEEHARPAFEDEQRILQTGEPIVGAEEKETWIDGREDKWVLTTKMPLFDGDGKIAGTFGLSRDITELKRHEQLLEQANAELVQSNKDLDDFAYIASHDLKEPLRGIANYVQFIAEDYGDKLDEEGHEKLNTLRRLCQRMDTLIETLLTFSRLGRAELAVAPTDLNELVAEIVDMMHVTLDEQNVDVRVPQPLPTLHCDRVRVGELLRNLIVNAVKYNDKPEKWVEIGCQPKDHDSSGQSAQLVFFVRDNGIGIREKHLGSIFRIFKRLHARDKYGGGTGSGLTFAKQIVERHGGEIWVESTYGEGTAFFFTLQSSHESTR